MKSQLVPRIGRKLKRVPHREDTYPYLTIKGASQETSKGQASIVLGASDPRGFLLGPYFTITHPDPP